MAARKARTAKKEPAPKGGARRAGAARKAGAAREPTPAALLKNVAAVSDSNKQLTKEIKAMSKIFADNQKILVSMKGMMDTVAVSLEQIQNQSGQIRILEDDGKKLFAGLNQVRGQADMVARINAQTAKLEEEVAKIQKSAPNTAELSQQVGDSMSSIRNNSQMIIKIAQRIDDVRDQLREVSGRTESLDGIGREIESLKRDVESGAGLAELKAELEGISRRADVTDSLRGELAEIGKTISGISEKAASIDSLEGVIDGLKHQFATIAEKAEPIASISAELDAMRGEIGSLARRADATESVGEGVRSMREDVSALKQNLANRANTIDQKISALAGAVRRTEESSSRDVMALLRLSEFQSRIRMGAESKYGSAEDIRGMAEQTGEIARLFEGDGMPEMPSDVRQWAVSKIFDCADRWEIRFSEVFSILYDKIGKESLKEVVRIQQVRDIYGIRAVDEIRNELGMS